MRGYGNDEPLVHERLNPGVQVVSDADRVRGAARAQAAGADCVVLDDAFQHRRIGRTADWVLVSAEQWRPHQRVLPAGPLREPLNALRRADVVLVTRRSATAEAAGRVMQALEQVVPRERIASCHLALGNLHAATGSDVRTLASLSGARVFAIAAVGTPQAFFAQLAASGAVVDRAVFGDHHAFTAHEVSRLVRDAAHADIAVCTLKDAVKLALLWTPTAMPLWYVSQHVVIEHNAALLDRGLEAVLAARHAVPSTAGPAGPSHFPHGHRSSIADR